MKQNLSELEKKLDINFTDRDLLLNAFVHRSYLNEHPNFDLSSNERLEFLGDACLELAFSEYLFLTYPDRPEGDLTSFRSAIVNTVSLAETARALNLGEYLLLSKGEEESDGRNSEYLLANAFEALLGAAYLEKGFDAVKKIVDNFLAPKLEEIVKNELYKDAKSKFQELAQETKGITPHYLVLEEWGPDHDKNFKVAVFVGKSKHGEGEGQSKQKAELAAASDALAQWEYNKEIKN